MELTVAIEALCSFEKHYSCNCEQYKSSESSELLTVKLVPQSYYVITHHTNVLWTVEEWSNQNKVGDWFSSEWALVRYLQWLTFVAFAAFIVDKMASSFHGILQSNNQPWNMIVLDLSNPIQVFEYGAAKQA